jgi:hypothetical protein
MGYELYLFFMLLDPQLVAWHTIKRKFDFAPCVNYEVVGPVGIEPRTHRLKVRYLLVHASPTVYLEV